MTLDFRELAHPVMVLVEGTRLDKGQQYQKRTTIPKKGQQYWTKNNNTGQKTAILDKGQKYRTKDKTQQRKTMINLSILT